MSSEDSINDCSLSQPYALQVLGKEMEPEFPDQCIIVVDPTDRCGDGAFVVALVEGTRWFRQYREDGAGRIWLRALDERYPEIELAGLDFQVEGVIVQRNIRRQVKHYQHFPDMSGERDTAP
jgi:SOS-response transcriptional repressor LexA